MEKQNKSTKHLHRLDEISLILKDKLIPSMYQVQMCSLSLGINLVIQSFFGSKIIHHHNTSWPEFSHVRLEYDNLLIPFEDQQKDHKLKQPHNAPQVGC